MAVRIQFRRGTASEWTTANPVLAEAEMGLEIDTGKFKVGNGTDTWDDLDYSSGPEGPAGADGATGATGPQGDPTTVNGKTGASITLDHTDVGADPAGAADAAEEAAKEYADDTFVPLSDMGVADGVATLGSDGKVPNSQLPPLAITETHTASSQSAMLALTAQVGDVAVRTDINKSFILSAEPASTLANWQELLTPPNAVLSVDGRTGAVSLSDLYLAVAHESDTTNIHGITDTSELETKTGAQAKADAAEADAIAAAASDATSKVSAHEADTTNVHGITNTANLLANNIENTITAQAAGSLPISIVSASGQTANLLVVRRSAGTVLFQVGPDGDVRAGAGIRIGSTVTYTSNRFHLSIENTSNEPGTNPTAGVIVYSHSGRFKVRDDRGIDWVATEGYVNGQVSAISQRKTATVTSGSIANGATWTGTVSLAKAYRLLALSTSVAARVRVYGTTAGRDLDVSRSIGETPTDAALCMLDFATVVGALSPGLSPLVDGASLASPTTTSIPISITNLSGSTAAITVTFTWLQTEA